MFQRNIEKIVDHPWAVLGVVLLTSTIAGLGYYDPSLLFSTATDVLGQGPGTRRQPPPDPPAALPNVKAAQLANSHAVVVVQGKDFFSSRYAEALRHVVKQIEALDYVESVVWMGRAPILNIFGLPEPILPRSDASAQRFELARAKAVKHPLIVGQLLSPDGETLLLLVQFDWLFIDDDDDCTTNLKRTAEQATAEFSDVQLTFQVTGRVPLELAFAARRKSNERKYQIIGNAFTLVMAMLLFRGLVPVVIVSSAPAIGMLWTLGVLNYFDLQDNPFNHVVLPILICMVGFTDGVHMMVQVRANRAAGNTARQSVRIALREVGLACALTSLTTAIGFGSLGLAHHEVVREFGWCCVLGVLLTFVAVVTIIPLLCLTPLGRRVHVGHSRGLIDRHFDRAVRVVDYVLRHYRGISWLSIASLLLLIGISASLRPDERITSLLPTNSEEAQALRHMDRAFGGLESAEIRIHWPSGLPADSAQILEVLHELDSQLGREPLIGHPISIANLIDALPGEGNASDRMSMLELLPPPLKRAFFVPEHRSAIVRFRIQDLGIAKYGPVFQRIEDSLASMTKQHPGFRLELSGDAVWRWRNLYQIVVDLATSLGTATIIICIVMSLVYGSLRIGLIAMVPNIFPLAATGTLLVVTGQALEIVSVCAFTVCLGIAVDDTIHFLTRYGEERKKTNDHSQAIRQAFVAVGTALIMTTIVLVGGFSTALLSDTRDHRIFASMGMLTIASALLADLILLPALLIRFHKWRSDK